MREEALRPGSWHSIARSFGRWLQSTGAQAVIVAVVAFAVSANTLRNGFVFDDIPNILQNSWIRDPRHLLNAFTRHMAAFDPGFDTSYYRPVMHVIFAGSYALFGERPWGFHLVVLLFHAAVTASVYLLLARWAPSPQRGAGGHGRSGQCVERDAAPGPEPGAGAAPLLAGLLFAVHPIHVDAVAWKSAIVDISLALFFLAAFLTATDITAHPAVRRVLAPCFYFIALLCKEPAAMLLPTLLVAYALRPDHRLPARRRDIIWQLAGFGAATFLYLVLRVNALGGLMGGGGAHRVRVALGDGIATAIALFGEYVKKLVLPVNLSAVHDFRVVTTPLAPEVVFGTLAITALGALAYRGRRHPGIPLGVALFAFPLAPALYVPVLGEGLFAERYLYLPSAGATLLLAVAITRPAALRGRTAWLGGSIIAAVIAASAAATVTRNAVWRDNLSLWTDAVQKAPRSAAAHEYLGFALLIANRLEAAEASLTRALELDAERIDARINLASALSRLGRPDEAIRHAERVLRGHPRSSEAYAMLGFARATKGQLAHAIVAWERALALNPNLAHTHHALGIGYARLGRVGLATMHLREAVRLEPGNPVYARDLALLTR